MRYFRQNLDASGLTLHDNTCLRWGLAAGYLDVTFIVVGWKKLLATGADGCGGPLSHTVRSQATRVCVHSVLCVCVCGGGAFYFQAQPSGVIKNLKG